MIHAHKADVTKRFSHSKVNKHVTKNKHISNVSKSKADTGIKQIFEDVLSGIAWNA